MSLLRMCEVLDLHKQLHECGSLEVRYMALLATSNIMDDVEIGRKSSAALQMALASAEGGPEAPNRASRGHYQHRR